MGVAHREWTRAPPKAVVCVDVSVAAFGGSAMAIIRKARSILKASIASLLIISLTTPTTALGGGDVPNFNRWFIAFGFDVAEIGAKFVPDDDPFVEGLPAYGNSFITQGYIYPAGTLDEGNGVLVDGSPEFPDKVIGTWTCYGFHVADAATATEGASVVTTQIYEFSGTPGKVSFVTDGFELVFGDSTPIRRAVTGGTGPLWNVHGQLTQSYLGFPNGGGGVNLRFRAKLRRF